MKTLCLYHRVDLDGWMSAAIVKHSFIACNEYGTYTIGDLDNGLVEGILDAKLIENKPVESLTFKGYTYGDKTPSVIGYDRIIMLDMALLKTVMEQLHEDHTVDIIWCDHHKTAIHDSEMPLKYNDLKGIRDVDFAACELTWNWFFPNEPMPEIVSLLGRYDCFKHRGHFNEIYIRNFQFGARQVISNYSEALEYLRTSIVASQVIKVVADLGSTIYNYMLHEANSAYDNRLEINLTDTNNVIHKFALLNVSKLNPENFDIHYQDDYDGVCAFSLKPNNIWVFSVYSTKFDVSTVAKFYGGGGHVGAAGFTVDGNIDSIASFINPRLVK